MFTIYSDKDIFENIISSPSDYPNWNKIINNHSAVCLDVNEVDLDTELDNPDSILFLFIQANAREIDLIPLNNYFQKIYSYPETVIENPTAAYFLNLTDNETFKLREETGMIINNAFKIDDNILFEKVNLEWLADEEINNNWNSILNPFNNFPSNSLIINDRNLFTNEESVKGTIKNIGIDNLIRIFDNLLPHNLKTDYHILILSEQKADIRNKSKCDYISNDLNDKIKELRNYNFQIEIVYYYSGTNFFRNTHNRRIYSNYKYGKSENGFASFKIRNSNYTRNDDSFILLSFFNNISSIQDTITNLKAHQNGISRYKELGYDCYDKLKKNGQNDRFYRYYLNGKEISLEKLTPFKNRLLN
jgi:hypothetical protein